MVEFLFGLVSARDRARGARRSYRWIEVSDFFLLLLQFIMAALRRDGYGS
jgi:hypothetical protein